MKLCATKIEFQRWKHFIMDCGNQTGRDCIVYFDDRKFDTFVQFGVRDLSHFGNNQFPSPMIPTSLEYTKMLWTQSFLFTFLNTGPRRIPENPRLFRWWFNARAVCRWRLARARYTTWAVRKKWKPATLQLGVVLPGLVEPLGVEGGQNSGSQKPAFPPKQRDGF